jgi:hypothetical protein
MLSYKYTLVNEKIALLTAYNDTSEVDAYIAASESIEWDTPYAGITKPYHTADYARTHCAQMKWVQSASLHRVDCHN